MSDFDPDEKALTPECKVRMARELMETLVTRDHAGNRLRVEWGEPNAEGFYCPTIHVDYADNIVADLRKRIEALERDLRFDIDFWRGLAVSLEPRLDVLAAEQHITPEDINRAAALRGEEAGTDGPTAGAPNA